MYYTIPFHARRLRTFYSQFIQPSDLVIDIGAHVGNRLRVFIGLNANVVALEPQPIFMSFLRRWYGKKPKVALIEKAVGAQSGSHSMWVSDNTPTVSSLSSWWVGAVHERDRSFAAIDWNRKIEVEVTTLDALIAEFGIPAFVKIDVEGYEQEVLKGLSQPIPALSFEYIATTLEIPCGCIGLLESLGDYEYNYTIIEGTGFVLSQWVGPEAIRQELDHLPVEATSGDVYARAVNHDQT
jgi:FkbM family methyltransferase